MDEEHNLKTEVAGFRKQVIGRSSRHTRLQGEVAKARSILSKPQTLEEGAAVYL